MKKLTAIVLAVFVGFAFGQGSSSIGLTTATSLSGCQANGTYTLCLYGSSTAPNVAVSVSGGAFQTVQGAQGPAGPAGATGPQGPPGPPSSFTAAKCSTATLGSQSGGLDASGCTEQ